MLGVTLEDLAAHLDLTICFNFETKGVANWSPKVAVKSDELSSAGQRPVVQIYVHTRREHQQCQSASYLLRAYAHLYLRGVTRADRSAVLERNFDDLARFGERNPFLEEIFKRGFFRFHRAFDVPLGQVMGYAAKVLGAFEVRTFNNVFLDASRVHVEPSGCFCGTDEETALIRTFVDEAPVDLLQVPHYRPAQDSWAVKANGSKVGHVCATSYVIGEGRSRAFGDATVLVQRTILGASCRPELAPLFI